MHKEINNWIIVGKDQDNIHFRPSDWASRICELGCTVSEKGTVKYSKNIRPIRHDGHIAVYVYSALKEESQDVWDHVMSFAKSNNLVVIEYHDPLTTFQRMFRNHTEEYFLDHLQHEAA